jgi:hypothetical protein
LHADCTSGGTLGDLNVQLRRGTPRSTLSVAQIKFVGYCTTGCTGTPTLQISAATGERRY